MDKKAPIELGNDIYLIDGFDLGFEGRTGTYVLQGEKLTLVETGPSPSVPRILEGLKDLSLAAEQVEYIILTHIHLDHAGGAGLLLQECPNAKVIVHERGKRHLVDPSKLIAGARAVYGDKFDQLFDPILPVPEEKILTKSDGETLDIDENRRLTFYDTPGHAKHHLGIFDSASQGIFTGDTAGIRYHQTEHTGLTFFLPTTSPNQFDPEAMKQSIERFRAMNPKRLFFGHFGKTENPEEAFDEVIEWIPIFVEEARTAWIENEGIAGIEERLHRRIVEYLNGKNITEDHPVFELLRLDFEVCAMGLADYLRKQL
ncbi:metallo-beta-lactamase family protein [Halobacillus halophilus DSM 2266]|uniref:Metallo-beta-lactamase family protein n=1 Tax=Halobacillus halophilus (strain ATCC 35676 / DSM 2266 / JCM 20832 / KCTC 3685 / LMG 17431 / NBRC 102448 / NCIMB 2269) TaxID=866895 RepID=I0JHF8_HALH3|nr:MBL fold metallo-hydrolase [Halobacillus halophilus]CCG43576.1 metallo-beta-lactamase family protein [Halobacillus halophilus DSM 2266]